MGAKDNDINHLLPVCLASGDGTTMTLSSSKDALAVDNVLRAICITMGYAPNPPPHPPHFTNLPPVSQPASPRAPAPKPNFKISPSHAPNLSPGDSGGPSFKPAPAAPSAPSTTTSSPNSVVLKQRRKCLKVRSWESDRRFIRGIVMDIW